MELTRLNREKTTFWDNVWLLVSDLISLAPHYLAALYLFCCVLMIMVVDDAQKVRVEWVKREKRKRNFSSGKTFRNKTTNKTQKLFTPSSTVRINLRNNEKYYLIFSRETSEWIIYVILTCAKIYYDVNQKDSIT